MVNTFLDLGYAVDLISYRNTSFKPKRKYDFFVGARTNFDGLAARLNDSCVKVVHLDTAHWLTNNYNAYGRLSKLVQRRNVLLSGSIRLIEQNAAIENADLATVLGNTFTIDSYSYANKQIYRIPIASLVEYGWQKRDIDAIRHNYLWFGSSGFVHKGLDLVLELFAALPDYQLFVCGPFDKEKAFLHEFRRELFESRHIHPVGWVDVNDVRFGEILKQCLGVIYPSCAEGGGGSVITCMHGGVIPVASYETSVDIESNGVILGECSFSDMQKAITGLSDRPTRELEEMAQETWRLAAGVHTRRAFAEKYQEFVLNVLLGAD
jgi:glycosyltransferase involved in cell wall biosynthesis